MTRRVFVSATLLVLQYSPTRSDHGHISLPELQDNITLTRELCSGEPGHGQTSGQYKLQQTNEDLIKAPIEGSG